jgi:hypothetical protein
MAIVATFYSAKMTPAQENYPVHEQELLIGIETMWHHWDILRGVHFTWIMDYKGLTHLLTQLDLSRRQARWLEKLSEFDFDIKYISGKENVFSDALSHIYVADKLGIVWHALEFSFCDYKAIEL